MSLPNNPQTRKEMYLSNMAGQGTALPSEPHTREEEYLDFIAKNGGGGGGTGDGDMKKSVYDGDLAVLSAGGIKAFVNGAIAGKVDKVDGKGLSTNDYDNSAKSAVDGLSTALNGKVDKIDGKGLSTNDYDDSAKAIVDGVTAELGNKADKVSSATNGDLASLDSNGNLTDSGKKASDFYNSSETLETDLDGQDKFPFYDFSASAKRQVTFGSIKAKLKEYFDLFYTNLVSSATNGNFAGLDANGNLTDSGKKASDFVAAVAGKGLSTNDYDDTEKAKVATAFPRSEQAVLGAKNFWRGYISPDPAAGVTYTQNADKSISTSGSATGEESFGRLMTNADLIAFINANKGKTFVLNGCPSGGSHTTYYISIWANNGLAVEDNGSGATFTIPSSDCSSANIAIHVKDGVDVSGKTWKPMISFDGGEYAPPAMTNKELTDAVQNKAGDSIYLNHCVLSGFVTSGTSEIFVNLPFKCTKINSILVDASLIIMARGIKGYLKDSAGTDISGTYYFNTNLKFSQILQGNNGQTTIIIKNNDDGAFTNVDNNTPVALEMWGNLTLS